MRTIACIGVLARMMASVPVLLAQPGQPATAPAALRVTVEAEEDVYAFQDTGNGAGPMWCHGSTCLVRLGEDVFASGIETLAGAKPLNNCRWTLYRRAGGGTGKRTGAATGPATAGTGPATAAAGGAWELVLADPAGRTREPCPLACFPDGRVMLSVNPTLAPPTAYSGPARPEILQFSAADPKAPPSTLLPVWDGSPAFTEHSYRSFAADGQTGEMILFQNIGYTHAEWAFCGRDGRWSARGRLVWPWGAEYEKPEPIRVCYPTVALTGRKVHFCGVSDIIEPNSAWRAYKKQATGRDWDYDFRRLFYTWSDDIAAGKFHPWVEVASREKTCGWIMPCDLHADQAGAVHILWTERAIDPQLREKFFPGQKQSYALNYAVLRDGQVVRRVTIAVAHEGESRPVPSAGRFHVTPDGRLLVVYFVSGHEGTRAVSQNRLVEVRPDGTLGPVAVVPLRHPLGSYFTATVRAGCLPSAFLDLLGHRTDAANRISYARVRIGLEAVTSNP